MSICASHFVACRTKLAQLARILQQPESGLRSTDGPLMNCDIKTSKRESAPLSRLL